MKPTNLDIPLKIAEKIKRPSDIFADNQDFIGAIQALHQATEFCEDQNIGRPLVISLVGGTGTGKSLIFSQLCGDKDASPSSDSVRGFTRKLHLAAAESDRPFLRLPEDSVILPGIVEGVVLIDTPDLDTIHRENAALTQQIIENSDILVFVTSPDKRSNFDIHETILGWASRKRWLFVMNKTDTAPDTDIDSLKRDFSKKIEELGFDFQEKHCFLFSAREADSFAFTRFKDAIFSRRSLAQNRLIREAAGLRQLLFATRDNPCFSRIRHLQQKVAEQRQVLEERLAGVPGQILANETIEQLTDQIRTCEVYRQLLMRRTGFMFPYIWVLSRINPSGSIIEVSSRISDAVCENKNFKDCRQDEERFFADLALNPEDSQDIDLGHETALAQKVKTNIIDAAHEISGKGFLGFYIFIANLLPAMVLLQALYRAFSHWLTGVWLPSDFFIHGAIIVAGSTLPGYLLVSKGIKRISSSQSIADLKIVLHSERLSRVQRQLENFLKEVDSLIGQCQLQLKSCENQIDRENGATVAVEKSKR